MSVRSRRSGIGRVVATAVAVAIGGSSSVLACPACFGAEETAMIDGARLGVLVMLAITVAVQGAFVAFFLYLRRRAKRIAEVEVDMEWAELQRTSRTQAAPRFGATGPLPARQVNVRGWGPAGPQPR
jgi:hypothetical protein